MSYVIPEHIRVREFLSKDNRILDNSQIDPWGSVRIVSKYPVRKIEPDPSDIRLANRSGVLLWSEKLLPYGSGNYRARLLTKVVRIFDGENQVVSNIKHDNFLVADIDEAYVHVSGWLNIIPHHLEMKDMHWDDLYNPALEKAEKGVKPDIFDNGTFVKVDKSLNGAKVVIISLGYPAEKTYVFTEKGERIPCKVSRLLAYKKWGVEPPIIGWVDSGPMPD